ncbi:hypothetical protein GLAREA_01830 [Glarea lozoyensis ATCC 20868]|uniref:Uncharacterized protein n=1 Tax=Glarea lozoyensis (strain ATCC 20868 / MF5171) TaxID=1116229 RepID=S3DH66_GLAL2|nr:uncharacterized protein GLAREA_01830 [Glarea lozoyensis ATCC 20868]EPE25918.1 hypothetical protein GLAREA_01830 [Glarea lozoyensis ATCC 20868]
MPVALYRVVQSDDSQGRNWTTHSTICAQRRRRKGGSSSRGQRSSKQHPVFPQSDEKKRPFITKWSNNEMKFRLQAKEEDVVVDEQEEGRSRSPKEGFGNRYDTQQRVADKGGGDHDWRDPVWA